MKSKININIFGYILSFLIVLLALQIYTKSETYNLKCIESKRDGNEYCVRRRDNIQTAADLLAEVASRMLKLVKYMKSKYPDRDNVFRLYTNYNPEYIQETLPSSELTAYSENKGEKLAFCLNVKKKTSNKFVDVNTLTFVAIHELGHVMSKTVGHNDEFWENFKFLLENAVDIKVYNPIDYKSNPTEYCGMTITDNPLYDA
tara:strand:- start:284 stop:889 length:606 start_codon:yes stop_codon:yes gene_type:complete